MAAHRHFSMSTCEGDSRATLDGEDHEHVEETEEIEEKEMLHHEVNDHGHTDQLNENINNKEKV
jgi:hypothetical protein